MGRSEGGIAVVTMQQTPHVNSGSLPGNLSMKDGKSNDKVKVLSDEEAIDDFPIGMCVLVVDDDPICLLLLESLLRHCKYNVTSCGQAIIALNLLRENKDKYDLVISDVYMPDMDGFKMLELVGLEMDLPVIMMSANGETSVVMKGINHGACDYLLKPVRIEELKNICSMLLGKRGQIARIGTIWTMEMQMRSLIMEQKMENMVLVPMTEQIVVGSLTGRGKNKMMMRMNMLLKTLQHQKSQELFGQ